MTVHFRAAGAAAGSQAFALPGRVGARRPGAKSGRTPAREHPALVVKHATLALLGEESGHGYAIVTRLQKRFGHLHPFSYGQVYRVLAALERSGLIEGSTEQVARRPARRVYAITAAGREAVRRWLMDPPAHSMSFGDDFYLRLPFVAALDSESRDALLGRQVHRCRRHLAVLTDRRKASPGTDADSVLRRLVLEAAILHGEADLEIVERARTELVRARAIAPQGEDEE